MKFNVMHAFNFREISMGNISPKTVYRSSHPIYNGRQVADIILSANNARIKTILNLSDSIQSLQSRAILCPWYKKIVDSGNVLALHISLSFNALDRGFCKKLKEGLEFMINRDPPYLIHCEAGIDRTGFLAIILESFMGAELNTIAKDYMLSFVDSSEYSHDDHRNGTIFIMNLFAKIKGELIDDDEDLQSLSAKYLAEYIGMDSGELKKLENKLMGKE
jgi:protein tyrosine/serine phosphatase